MKGSQLNSKSPFGHWATRAFVVGLAHVPMRWNHLIDKNRRQTKSLSMILSQEWFHFCGSCSKLGCTSRMAVPVLWDKVSCTIRSTGSSDFSHMLISGFNGLQKLSDDDF